MIEQGRDLKNVKKIGVNSQSCKFLYILLDVSKLDVSKLENSRKVDKSVWYILPPLINTELRRVLEVSMI